MKRWQTGVYLAWSGNRMERRWREVKVIWSCLAEMEAEGVEAVERFAGDGEAE